MFSMFLSRHFKTVKIHVVWILKKRYIFEHWLSFCHYAIGCDSLETYGVVHYRVSIECSVDWCLSPLRMTAITKKSGGNCGAPAAIYLLRANDDVVNDTVGYRYGWMLLHNAVAAQLLATVAGPVRRCRQQQRHRRRDARSVGRLLAGRSA